MIRTRIAPSPTGQDLHIGNVYTALINYAFAKKNDGLFIVRIEDTDQKRKVEGSEERILDSLQWFGLKPDEPVYRQSDRLEKYKSYAHQLVADGHAYICDCTTERLAEVRAAQQKRKEPPRYDKHCRNKKLEKTSPGTFVVRMKIPEGGSTSFTDQIRGEIVFQNNLIDDQVILKSDGYPTYHLAVVVDDHLMRISHVIRAEDWISSTPKHILLYNYFEWDAPKFAHVPLLRNTDTSKLSKRKNPVWASWYREQGLLSEAILNYLALMGWSMPDEREIFSLEEFIKEFSLERVQTSAPVFDIEKLKWINGEYIRKSQISNLKSQIIEYLKNFVSPIIMRQFSGADLELVEKTIPLIQTRIKTLSEYWPMCEFFFEKLTAYEGKINKEWVSRVVKELQGLSVWNHEALYKTGSEIADELGISKSKLFMDIRIAITGKKIGPPLFESMEILGREECLDRINKTLH